MTCYHGDAFCTEISSSIVSLKAVMEQGHVAFSDEKETDIVRQIQAAGHKTGIVAKLCQ